MLSLSRGLFSTGAYGAYQAFKTVPAMAAQKPLTVAMRHFSEVRERPVRCCFTLRTSHVYFGGTEEYDLPASEAAEFLKQLHPKIYESNKYSPVYKVENYYLYGELAREDRKTYLSSYPEPPLKAALKIELFIKNPAWMPKTPGFLKK